MVLEAHLSSHGCVPLIVGVTGHRDIVAEERPVLEASVQRFIAALQAQFPNLPLLVLTSIAEGADTLVAEVAIRSGCQVQIVLPMPLDLFATDFEGDALVKFHSLMAGQDVIELPVQEGVSDEAVSQSGHARDGQYVRLGSFLAAHSHILLALWDGQYQPALGGTSQVIHIHQRDISAMADTTERSRLDIRDDESDLVYHIPCSRKSSGTPAHGLKPGEGRWFTRDDTAPRVTELPLRYLSVFERAQEFNQDVCALKTWRDATDLQPDVLPAAAESRCADIRALFLAADALGRRFQKRVLWSLRLTLTSVVGAGLSFILYADFADQDYMIWGYLLFVALTLVSYLLAGRRQWHRRYVDYRVLAEALRVQFYWALSGVEMTHPHRFSHDSFFQGRDLQLGWIRNVMRFTGLQSDGGPRPDATALMQAVDGWVGDENRGQFGYFRQKAEEKLKTHRLTQKLITLCFSLGVTAAAVLAFAVGELATLTGNLLVALMGVLPITAAVRQTYAHRTAERELVAQFANMRTVFENAHRMIAGARTREEQLQILRDLGEAALSEQAQWVVRQRERPLPGSDAMA